MKTSSCKAKGRHLQQTVRDKILSEFSDLSPDDVRSTSMGSSGEDILLSPLARLKFPFSVECKNQESINIWSSIKQTEINAKEHIPLLIFKRNKSTVYCVLSFDNLLKLIK